MIYLIQIERLEHHSMDVLPLGPLQVGSALKNAGFPVTIRHIQGNAIDGVVAEVARAKPLWVGLSVITGPQTCDSAIFSERLKSVEPSIPIVWGGIHPSLTTITEQCISEPYIDFVVVGEGEETAIELSQELDLGATDFEGLLGLAWKNNGRPVINEKRPFIKNLDDDRYRIDYELIDVPSYFGLVTEAGCSRVVSYKTSRGCPWQCAFCYVQEFHNRRYRAKSPERVIEDIQFLKQTYGIDGVHFYDDEFYVRRERALKIIENIGIPAKTDIRIDQITEDIAERMKARQVFDVLIGVESGSDRMLELMQKGFKVSDIKRGVELLAKYDIKVGYSAIVGMPTETREEMNATIDLFLWIDERHKNKSVTVGPFLPYPGAPLYHFAIQHGFVPPTHTKGWEIIDRWSPKTRLPWCQDDYVYQVREYLKFFDYKVPLLARLARARLKRRFFHFPVDRAAVRYLYHHGVENNGVLAKGIRKMHQLAKAKQYRGAKRPRLEAQLPVRRFP